MTNLITRLEAAGEGSFEIDEAITRHIGWTFHIEGHDDDLTEDVWTDPQGKSYPCHPFFTTSIDAAMSLASGFGGQVTFFKDGTAKAFLWQPYPLAVEAKGATPALALCIAALKAREAGEEG